MHRERRVRHERPRRRRPHQDPPAVAERRASERPASRSVERDVHARILDVLVPLRHLVARQRRAAARAVRQDLVPAIQQLLVEQRLERPPHALDVVVRVRDVRMRRSRASTPMRALSFSQSPRYLNTLSRHSRLNSATPSASICCLPLMPSCFSTSISTGRPCVSQPALRATRNPFIARWRQKRSLIVREKTWWMPGRPFAVGGPSKKTNVGAPSRAASVCSNRSSASQRASSSCSSSSAGRSAGSSWIAGHARRGHRRSSTPRTSAVSCGSARFATRDDALERRRLERVGKTHVGDDREAEHAHAGVHRHDAPRARCDMPTTSAPIARSMRYSARVSRFGPATATYTPSRSVIRSSRRDGARDRAQARVVRRRHVGKARPEPVVVRPDERIVAEQVDVVGDQHQVAGRPERIHARRRRSTR